MPCWNVSRLENKINQFTAYEEYGCQSEDVASRVPPCLFDFECWSFGGFVVFLKHLLQSTSLVII